MEHKYPELARRLATAAVSCIAGVGSMDHFMREHVTGDVGPFWHQLAEQVMDAISQPRDAAPDVSKLIH
jgi:hypothetical protein